MTMLLMLPMYAVVVVQYYFAQWKSSVIRQ
jgi:hypothetical protein